MGEQTHVVGLIRIHSRVQEQPNRVWASKIPRCDRQGRVTLRRRAERWERRIRDADALPGEKQVSRKPYFMDLSQEKLDDLLCSRFRAIRLLHTL